LMKNMLGNQEMVNMIIKESGVASQETTQAAIQESMTSGFNATDYMAKASTQVFRATMAEAATRADREAKARVAITFFQTAAKDAKKGDTAAQAFLARHNITPLDIPARNAKKSSYNKLFTQAVQQFVYEASSGQANRGQVAMASAGAGGSLLFKGLSSVYAAGEVLGTNLMNLYIDNAIQAGGARTTGDVAKFYGIPSSVVMTIPYIAFGAGLGVLQAMVKDFENNVGEDDEREIADWDNPEKLVNYWVSQGSPIGRYQMFYDRGASVGRSFTESDTNNIWGEELKFYERSLQGAVFGAVGSGAYKGGQFGEHLHNFVRSTSSDEFESSEEFREMMKQMQMPRNVVRHYDKLMDE